MNRLFPATSMFDILAELNRHFGVELMRQMSGCTYEEIRSCFDGNLLHPAKEMRLLFGHCIFSMLADRNGPETAVQVMCSKDLFLDGEDDLIGAILNDRYDDVAAAVGSHLSQEFG